MTAQVYFHDWAEGGEAEMLNDFGITAEALDGATVLVASYTYGDAYVLFERDGKLFEVHGGHCSCYGLSEGDYYGNKTTQWHPEEIDAAVIRKRATGSWGEEAKINDHTLAAIDRLIGNHTVKGEF